MAAEKAALERRRKEREEAHLYMDIQVASEENFRAHQGFDIAPFKSDTESAARPKVYRTLRAKSLADFLQTVAEDLGTERDLLRPWAMINRQNGTTRPESAITMLDMSVEEVSAKYGSKMTVLKLWVEKAQKRDEAGAAVFGDQPVQARCQPPNRPLMLFLKHFDAKAQTLYGVGNVYAAYHDRVQDVAALVCTAMDWPAGTSIRLNEVGPSTQTGRARLT